MPKASKLFQLCTSKRWDEAIELVKSRPVEAEILQSTGKRGAAPISAIQIALAHAKCRGDVPIDLIDALLEAAPGMASQKHLYTGNLPLHAVFYNPFYSASKRTTIAERIIQACPKSVTMCNNDGRTPLHTICSQHCNYEPILALLRAGPQTASWADKNGDLPIHLACRSQKSPNKSIRALYDAHPPGILSKNNEGLTPIDVAEANHRNESSSGGGSSNKNASRIALLHKLRTAALTATAGAGDATNQGDSFARDSPETYASSEESSVANDECTGDELGRVTTKRARRSFDGDVSDVTSQSRFDRNVDVDPTGLVNEKRRPVSGGTFVAPEGDINGEENSSFTLTWMEENSPHILLAMTQDYKLVADV